MSECPLMTPAWMGFMHFALGSADLIKAFEAETGIRFPPKPRTAMDAMVDEATGILDSAVQEFTLWATWSQWGEAGVPDRLLAEIPSKPWWRPWTAEETAERDAMLAP